MSIEGLRSITSRSKEMLDLARHYAEQIESLPEGDDKRAWLEEEAKRLIQEARALTQQAKEQMTKINK
ncbi:hypothetical protein [Sulfuriflexus mobilis]|uniref:hypothetical protein n=1 Tax=Sulfuriflexus mobilis TaxID=1811807 RepID=UPI000F81DABD|nr:hypothetical protein [Sulfuriflexus mobilis]